MPLSFDDWLARQQGGISPLPRTPLTSSVPEQDTSSYLKGLLGRGALTAFNAVEPLIDYIGRPQTALSEAYGAHQSGDEGELSAAWRGLTKGYKKAKYGTFGEQLVPEQEGEDLGRKIGRFGVEVLTDPTTYLAGTGLGKKLIGTGLQKVATPALKATSAAIKAQPWAQKAARLVVPYSKLGSMFGGESGTEIGRLATEGFEETGRRLGSLGAELEGVLRSTKLHKSADARKLVTDVLEGNPVEGADAQLAAWLRTKLDEIGDEAQELGLKVLDPASGTLNDFRKIPYYVPRMFKHGVQDEINKLLAVLPDDEVARAGMLKGPKASKTASAIGKMLNVSDEQARNIMYQYAVKPRKAGHLEIARQHMPEELKPFLERDPVEWFTRYAEQAIPRIEMAKRFGTGYEKLADLLQGAQGSGLVPELAEDFAQIIKGVVPVSKYGIGDALRGAMAFQTLGKLGPTTSVLNLGQQVNTYVKEGTGAFLKSVGRQFSPAQRQKHLPAYLSGLRDHMQMLTGQANPNARLPRAAQTWLRVVGFTPIEKTNRIGSSIAGVVNAEDMAKRVLKLKASGQKVPEKLSRRLREYGVDESDLRHFASTGRLPTATEELVGLRASQISQHPTSPWELPPAWRSPEMRLFLQFKRFAYNQSRFMYEQVARPAYKWFETGGVDGDIGPLLRSLAAFPPAGVAVGSGREGVRDLQAWFVGAKSRPSRNDFDNHPTAAVLRNMLYVGAFGMAGDVLERSYRSGLSDYFLGPSVSDLMDVTERLTKGGYKAAVEGEYPGIEDLLLQLYSYGGRGALGVTPTQLKEASTHRGLPGAVREMF